MFTKRRLELLQRLSRMRAKKLQRLAACRAFKVEQLRDIVFKKVIAQGERHDFDEQVAPEVRDFWQTIREKDSVHKQRVRSNPFYALYGDELSREGYGRYKNVHSDPQTTYRIFLEIQESERDYERYLEQLAVEIVSEIWGCPQDILEAHLGSPPPLPTEEGEIIEAGEDLPPEETEELRNQIDKRIIMNTLTHGAAIHQMSTAHHIARKKIEAFDDELIELYDQLAKSAHKNYWQFYLDENNAMMAGVENVKWDEEEDTVKVVAYGVVFPVLLQELSKGVMELLTAHGLADLDPQTQKHVVEKADRLDEEPWLIQVGPELWRRFLKVIPRDVPLSDLIAEFSTSDPSEVQEVLEAVIDNPDRAREILTNIQGRLGDVD